MGEEMSEQQSDEITKAMDHQRELENRYAKLVMQRGWLKGLSHKDQLKKTKIELLVSQICLAREKQMLQIHNISEIWIQI